MPVGKYQLFLIGLKNETTIVRIDKDAKVAQLRKIVSDAISTLEHNIGLFYAGIKMEAENEHGEIQYLSDYNIHDQCNIFLALTLLGGSDKDPRVSYMEDCPKKVIVGVQNCPSVRACPTCGMLIEHKDKCKHITCPCGQRFCFICLKITNVDGAFQCGASNFQCEVAPLQMSIPGN